jgi:hypothetical protein
MIGYHTGVGVGTGVGGTGVGGTGVGGTGVGGGCVGGGGDVGCGGTGVLDGFGLGLSVGVRVGGT